MLGNSNLGPRKCKNQRAPIEQHRQLACFHPATKIVSIVVSPYIAASEMYMSLVCINVTRNFFSRVVFVPAFFPAGQQTCLVA